MKRVTPSSWRITFDAPRRWCILVPKHNPYSQIETDLKDCALRCGRSRRCCRGWGRCRSTLRCRGGVRCCRRLSITSRPVCRVRARRLARCSGVANSRWWWHVNTCAFSQELGSSPSASGQDQTGDQNRHRRAARFYRPCFYRYKSSARRLVAADIFVVVTKGHGRPPFEHKCLDETDSKAIGSIHRPGSTKKRQFGR
jgi:hypothetical protein